MSHACELPSAAPANEKICNLLKETKIIVIVGLSPKEHRDSHIVGKYMQDKGFKVIPVYPREETILGEKVYRSLDEVKADYENVDIVNIFRKAEDTPPIAKKAINNFPNLKSVWLQETIINEEVMSMCEEAGIIGIQDHCIMVEDKRC
jgi:predicted CoA-binding protein